MSPKSEFLREVKEALLLKKEQPEMDGLWAADSKLEEETEEKKEGLDLEEDWKSPLQMRKQREDRDLLIGKDLSFSPNTFRLLTSLS